MWNKKVNSSKIVFLITIFILKFSRITSLVPDRAGHIAVIIGDQIVFMGGSHFIPPTNPIKNSIRVYNLSDEVFSLSLSSQFSTSNPSYADISDTSARMKFGSEKGTAVLGGPSGVNVYLIGGVQQNLTRLNEIDNKSNITSNQTLTIEEINKTYNMTNQSVFFYQPYGKSWLNLLDQKGTPPTRRRSTSTVINQKGIIYIFGGRSQVDTGSPIFICYNDLYTFDTVLLSWNQINVANVPSPRSHSAPVLLPNGKILYIGGVSQTQPGVDADLIDMNEIPVFDTISSTWSYKYASRSILVQPRLAHTATLLSDNNEIIIIGGNSNYHLQFTTVSPIFLSLNIAKEPYEYSELITSGDKPPPLAFHTANLYQNYLIIAFGNITNYATEPAEINSRIYLLDIQCKAWVTTFTPGRSICSSGSKINVGMIVGIIVSVIVLVIALCFLYNNWRKVKDYLCQTRPESPRLEMPE
ncbi:galactose oxidase [Gigaspora margarita]|uniref:Galactose oxidase n=1 Tax=Gigaspora margarita TaxID=4874 RepID=A0A8H3XDD7_GIGMA|nr:galactose oxidase [Gigaspora margarita]